VNVYEASGTTLDTGANGVPSGYTHLLIIANLRTGQSTALSSGICVLNNDSSGRYGAVTLQVNNSVATAGYAGSVSSSGWPLLASGSIPPGGRQGANIIWVPRYADGNFVKLALSLQTYQDDTFTAAAQYGRIAWLTYDGSASISRVAAVAGSGGLVGSTSALSVWVI
jgi:hypothetical protein